MRRGDPLRVPWLYFIGLHELHMRPAEIRRMKYGEMIDMINCLAVFNDRAEFVNHRAWSYEEAMSLS